MGDIPVPPKYQSKDFRKPDVWRLRGAPRRAKGSAGVLSRLRARRRPQPRDRLGGWNALQQAQALAAWYLDAKEREGWPAERLVPLLAGLRELLPWLKQWHNDYDPEFAVRQGDYFDAFVRDEARTLGKTIDETRMLAAGTRTGPAGAI